MIANIIILNRFVLFIKEPAFIQIVYLFHFCPIKNQSFHPPTIQNCAAVP